MSPGFFAQAYQRTGQDRQALDSMVQFVDAIAGTVQKPNPVLSCRNDRWGAFCRHKGSA